jgi:hypothetical protein
VRLVVADKNDNVVFEDDEAFIVPAGRAAYRERIVTPTSDR